MKRWGILLLTLCLAAALFSVQVFASETEIVTGTCGSTATWSLDTQTGVLTISGTGPIKTNAAPNNDTYIPWKNYTSTIKTVVIEEGITDITTMAFFSLNVNRIEIPSTVTSIAGDFVRIMDPNAIVIDEKNEHFSMIDGVLFQVVKEKQAAGTELVTLVNLVKYPARSEATEYTVPEGVTAISTYAFSDADNLRSLSFPDSVVEMGEEVCHSCSNLVDVKLPAHLTYIPVRAFYYCSSLETIEIPTGVEVIQNYAFQYCRALKNVTIPDTVTRIFSHAFSQTAIETIDLPENLYDLGDAVFWGCSKLNNVIIPEGVTKISSNLFESCRSLSAVQLPAGLAEFGHYAFLNCSNLNEVLIPESVETIGYSTFHGCEKLSGVYFLGNAPSVSEATHNLPSFDAETTTLYYREGTTGWTDGAAYNAEKGTWNGYPLKTWEPMEPAVLTISSETVNPGKTATLTVSISGNPGLAGYRFELLADPAVITLSNAQRTGVSENAMTFQSNATENGLVLVCLNYEDMIGDGALFTVQATVAEDAPEGVYAVELVCNPSDITNEAGTQIPVEKENGRVAVTNYSKGDLTGEGKVSNADLIRLSRSVLGMTELNLGQSLAADVNGDGKITNADTIRLARSLLGLVEL